jgi:DNA-binding beta-propeller fold protein YncE
VIRLALAALALGAAGVAAAAVGGLVQLPGAVGCVSARVAGCTAGGIGTADAVTVSPDGRNVYVAGGIGSNGAMAILRRDVRTGQLFTLPPKRGCVHVYRGSARCVGVRALETPSSIAVSPDGHNVYVAASSNSAVTTFARRADGSLTQPAGRAACIANYGGPCARANTLTHPTSVALSPDGRTLYAVGNSSIVVLARNPATGRLTQPAGAAGCVNVRGASGCTRVNAGSRIYRGQVVVSRDGRNVYAATGGILYVLARDATGVLTPRACFDANGLAGCTATTGIGQARTVAVSRDGTVVYTAAGARSVLAFDRDPSTGALTAGTRIALPFRVLALSTAGPLVTAAGDRGVATIAAGAVRGTVPRVRAISDLDAVAGSGNGRSVYAAGSGGVAVLAAR